MTRNIKGVYAITPESLHGSALMAAVDAALRGGVAWLQYRDKSKDAARRLQDAKALRALTEEFGVGLIINDDVDLALAVGADGVHLGRDDGDLLAARRRFPAGVLGASCYASLPTAQSAEQAGASYVAFGAVFGSSTKPDARPCALDLLPLARQRLQVPMVAIGGIAPGNVEQVLATGVDSIAVSAGIFAAADIEHAARQLCNIFARNIATR